MFLGLSCWAQDLDSNPGTLKLKGYIELDGNHSKMAVLKSGTLITANRISKVNFY